MKTGHIEGVTYKLGKTAEENESLVKMADSCYTWVHLESFPSGHLILETADPSTACLQEAGKICRDHTKYNRLRNLRISVCPVANLKLVEGAKGQVEFHSHRRVTSVMLEE